MAFSYGFYNSLNHDRTYDAEDISRLFDGLITDGIIGAIGDTFAVKATSGNTVNVCSGRAWFDHTWTLNTTEMSVNCPQAGVLLDRYDAIVLEVDASADVRANSIKVISGSEDSNPVKPAMVKTETVHQYPLAYILRKAGSNTITQSSITNTVGTSECPICKGILESMSADQIIAQWDAAYNEWFASTKNAANTEMNKLRRQFDEWFADARATLSEDVAGNLLNKINASGSVYYARLTLDGWTSSGIPDYPYEQVVAITPEEETAPPATENSKFLSDAFFTPTTSAARNAAMSDVLELINSGVTYCDNGTVRVCIEKIPASEIVVKWVIRG